MNVKADIARIMDANFNRARETLRVLEEYARLVSNDANLADLAKQLRHDIATVIADHHLEPLVRARDIVGDVGTDLQSEAEYRRDSPEQVVHAAGKRLGEALRVLEEYGKTVNERLARSIEQLRYRGYELERRLAVRIHARQRFGGVQLYVILTESLCRGDWLQTARAAIAGGADCLQLREKELPDGELFQRARQLTALCHKNDLLCIINDRADVAVAAGADGVHLGQDDLTVPAVRRIVGPGIMVGLSTHTLDQVRQASEVSPDYIAVGPMFASTTKPRADVAGVKLLSQVVQITSLPVVAIGGIDASNAGTIAQTGGACVCVCSAIIAAKDPAAAAKDIRCRLER